MKLDQIKSQIEDMPAAKLAYLAGFLSRSLGMSRTAKALDLLYGMTDLKREDLDYFTNFVCLLGLTVADDEWDRALQTTKHLLRSVH